ncbi:class D sortase [Bacillus sp. B-jedd]|uniref:class D sortase n=1 Tax=Bacillus sp. B-jedd TaxID=1476857 RepID=UPI0006625005|nr:class D sortase [Bacillus sp. B-jedd]
MLLILAGTAALAVGGYQLIEVKLKGEQSLEEAKKLVSAQGNSGKADADEPQEKTKPDFGEIAGLLEIPKIKSELAIVEGTDPNDLKKGVGHYEGSFFPGENGQIVLSGHRDTVFRRLGELEKGDTLKMRMPAGDYDYEITGTKIVDADDRSIITLQNEEEELIVTTCYPFRYVGNAPDRYIIYAKPKQSN